MKKLVVSTKEKEIFFEGENLEAINKADTSCSPTPETLIIKNNNLVQAVFLEWDYWRKVE